MDATRRRLAAFRICPVGIFETDPDGTTIFVNDRWCELTGMTSEQALGDGWIAALHPEDLDRVVSIWRAAVDEQKEYAIECRFVRSDRSEVWVQGSAVPLRDGDGTLVGFVGSMTDITPRVHAEAAKRMMRQRIELADRLASLGTLSAGIGHEINNPLAALMMSLDHLSSRLRTISSGGVGGTIEPELLEDIDLVLTEANASVERIGKIVRGVTNLAAPRDHESIREVRVQDAVERVVAMCTHEIGSTKLVRDFRPAPRVLADPIGLSQVYLNLILNALQAIEGRNNPDDYVRLATYLSETGEVVGEVEDTGPGVPEELAGRIFEPFFTTKPPGKGTGLGLAVSHQIVRGLGGRLEVITPRERGALFRVTLPAAELRTASVEQGEDAKIRLLIVEEEYGLLVAYRRMLEPSFLVATERDAPTALARMRRGERFDVILCSLILTELSTAKFYEEVGKIDVDQAARMTFLSGLPLRGEEQESFAAAHRTRLVSLSAGHQELQGALRRAARASR